MMTACRCCADATDDERTLVALIFHTARALRFRGVMEVRLKEGRSTVFIVHRTEVPGPPVRDSLYAETPVR